MNFKTHFLLMADYNLRMNDQVILASCELSHIAITSDNGAFFGSILGTLNHILVGDLIWLSRFSTHSNRYRSLIERSNLPKPTELNEMLCSSLDTFKVVRNRVDLAIKFWLLNDVIDDDFTLSLQYANTKGVISERNFASLLSHLFNHQTHHRGQVSSLLHQQGVDIGITDFLIDIPDIKLTS